MHLPDDFAQYTRQLFGGKLYEAFSNALDEEPPVSIRLNPFKLDLRQYAGDAVPWCQYGRYLGYRPPFTLDPMLHAGLYYVQEASSMFVCEVARQLFHEPLTMLDLCAAPGGKTTALRSALPQGSLLFSNEPVKARASILKENVQKFGHPDVIVTNNYPKDYRKSKLSFDAILADVPCSGEGMFRKDPNTISEWSPGNVEKCSQLQRSIIEDIWPCLSEGGILIYSTCTFNAKEDEENVQWIAQNLGAEFVEIKTPQGCNITSSLTGDCHAYRFIPGRTKGEGLFLAVLRKSYNNNHNGNDGNDEHGKRQKKAKQKTSATSSVSNINTVRGWLKGDFSICCDGDSINGIPSQWTDIYNNVKHTLRVVHAGVSIGAVKGKDIVPDTSLAHSLALDKSAFGEARLNYDEAIRFLRKEAITLGSNIGKGFVLVTYHDTPLGFVKNLGSRANNLYPQEWRVKTTHTEASCAFPLQLLSQDTRP